MEGKTVSHYRILEKIGEGGMGQVYLAEDTALERKVALKFLPLGLQTDPVAHKRFIREAKSAAAIEHPFICNIKEVSQTDDGQDFIVMEYVEGQTLKDRLEEGQLPIKEALQTGSEVAEALEKAHSAGVIHRDLKPSNIMITPEGHVKVLDFGLAKRVTRDKEDLTSVLTREGTTLGTLAYMSPEQLRGSPVDARADVFSLGVVLYEMLTGVHPFSTGTQAETVNAILSEHPSPLSRYVESVPDLLQHTIKKMLAKQPGERYQTVHEIRTNLTKVMEEITSPTPLAEPEKKRGKWIGAVALLLALVVVLAAVVFWPGVDKVTEAPSEPMQIRPLTSDGREKWTPRLSPDGEYVAYVALSQSGIRNIYVQSIGEGAEELKLTDHPDPETGLAWSPDGKQLAFIRSKPDFSGGVLYTIPAPLGGQERKVVDLNSPTQVHRGLSALSWSPDGLWIAKADKPPNQPSRIVLISPQSGEITPLTDPPDVNRGDEWPSFSPDGSQLAFFRERRLWLYDTLEDEEQQVTNEYYEFLKSLAWTPDGREIVFAGSKAEYMDTQLFRVLAAGGEPRLLAGTGIGASDPNVRGSRLVYVQTDAEEEDIWRVPGPNSDLEQKPKRVIRTNRRYRDTQHRVSPDGESIAFASNRNGFTEIWIANVDGSNPRQLSFVQQGTKFPAWSPDGKWITFVALDPGKKWGLYIVDAQGGEPRFLTSESFGIDTPSWSHDGQWIYFKSPRSGTSQIWKMPAEGGEAIQLTHSGGVFRPLESANGQYVYYLKRGVSTGTIWRVPVQGGEEEEVLAETVQQGGWDILRNRLYYSKRKRGESFTIYYLDLETEKKTEFFRHEGSVQGSYLSVSSDERWIFYAMKDPTVTSDIMLVENFR